MLKLKLKKLLTNMLDCILLVRDVSYGQSLTIGARNYSTITLDVSRSGYKAIAVVSMNTSGTQVFSLGSVGINASGTSASISVWNHYSDSRTATATTFKVIYLRAR